ncbi:MAG: hypothetical protein ACI9MB_001375 [Verrucomicrobiales bacterium]|jgi:hypothetical protein
MNPTTFIPIEIKSIPPLALWAIAARSLLTGCGSKGAAEELTTNQPRNLIAQMK